MLLGAGHTEFETSIKLLESNAHKSAALLKLNSDRCPWFEYAQGERGSVSCFANLLIRALAPRLSVSYPWRAHVDSVFHSAQKNSCLQREITDG
ncbi:hypothetical protein AJ87_40020 [Rhizobium yanglingense]|nr:hypothetical protein AJ87_40020 [Rhizobium yanglingense]